MDTLTKKELFSKVKNLLKERLPNWTVFAYQVHPHLGEQSDWNVLLYKRKTKKRLKKIKPYSQEKYATVRDELREEIEFLLPQLHPKAYFGTLLAHGICFPLRIRET